MSIHRLVRLTALLALLGSAAAPRASAQGYPRLGLYWSIHRDGRPLLDSTGVIDPVVAGQITRYHQVVLDVDPLSPYRPDVLQSLRQMHPGIQLLGYVTGHYIWPSDDPDSLNHFPTRYWHLVRNLDGFLYNTQGQLFGLTNYAFADVNLAKRDLQGRYVVAESLATLFWDAVVRNGNWDGVFLDTFCEGILWAQTTTEQIDFARAGYASASAFDAAWKAGGDTLAARLRQLSGPNPILVGNCAVGTKYAWFNGWMRENFPYQNGGTWYTNMLNDPGGYLNDDRKFVAPRNNFIFSAASPPTSPYTAENLRRVRYGLGSAALGDGYGVFGYGGRATDLYPYWTWWYDEYAVDLATGRSSARLQDTGWLGLPAGSWYQMIWVGTNPDAVTNPDFETDLSGWNKFTGVPSTMTRDTTTAGSGRASLHLHIDTPGTIEYQGGMETVGSIAMTYGQTYSATFWAKASHPWTFPVVANSPPNEYARRTVTIGTSWQRFQVALVSLRTGTARLQFFCGLDSGDVWVDDVHFQQGATTLYRRDFQNGVVLVNPSGDALSVPLGSGYKNILGSADPVTNDGATVTSVTVPPGDARFLLTTRDVVPPAAVTDLRIGP